MVVLSSITMYLLPVCMYVGGVVSALAFSVLRRVVRGIVGSFSYIFGLVSEKED